MEMDEEEDAGGGEVRPADEEAEARWCTAMVQQATATSVVKDEADPVWLEDVLRGVLGHGANTGVAAYPIDTDAKRLVLARFLGDKRSGAGAALVPLSQRLLWEAVEKGKGHGWTLYLDSLFGPQVALAVRHPAGDPAVGEVLLHALHTEALLAVLACLGFGVAASPIASWHLVHVDPLHETGLRQHMAASPDLHLTRRETQRLYVFAAECLSAWLPEMAAAGAGQLRPFTEGGGRRGHGLYNSHDNDVLCAATVAAPEDEQEGEEGNRNSSSSSCWTLSTLPAYRGRGLEVPLLRVLVQQERRGGEPLWVGVAEEEEGMDAVLTRLGFVCAGTGITLHVASSNRSSEGMCT